MTRWFFPAFAATTLIVGIGESAVAQSRTPDANPQVQSKGPVLRSRTDLRSIAVRVTNAEGNDVKGLAAEDFVVLEDGHPQKIAFFGSESVPTSLAVLVDSSSSMNSKGQLGSARSVAAEFLRSARPDDEIFAMDFTDQIGAFQRLTREQVVSSPSLPLSGTPSNGASLYDAIATAICHLEPSQNLRQAIVVVSDGIEQHSRITLNQLVELVRRSPRAQLFMIGLNSRTQYESRVEGAQKMTLVSGREIDTPSYVFDQLEKESGAEARFLNRRQDLNHALKSVSDALRAQYTVAYYPPSSRKAFLKIEVRVKRPGLKVTTRRGVSSAESATEPVYFDGGTCTISEAHHPYPFDSKLTEGPKGMIYREDFSDPRSGWPNRPESRYAGGHYEITNKVPLEITSTDPTYRGPLPDTALTQLGPNQNVLAAYGPWWQNFRASVVVDAQLAKRSPASAKKNAGMPSRGSPSPGLVFRLNDVGYYALLLSTSGGASEPAFEVVKKEYGTSDPVEIIPWTRIHVPLGDDPEIKLSVQDVGSQITVYLNDQLAGSAQEESYKEGYTGLIEWGPGHAVFRDLVVEEIR